jgi:hypothetical protein
MQTTLTRTDCTRDDVRVPCPNATTLGFGLSYCKRGFWVEYEIDNQHHVGRAIGRVTCEGKVYIEVAQATLAFSTVHIRWIEPAHVREVRRAPPRHVFNFFADTSGWHPDAIFRALEYGVSDLHDQIDANEKADRKA